MLFDTFYATLKRDKIFNLEDFEMVIPVDALRIYNIYLHNNVVKRCHLHFASPNVVFSPSITNSPSYDIMNCQLK